MIALYNVYVDVLRSIYTVAGGSDVPQPYLSRVPGHLTRIKDSQLMVLPASALKAVYEIYTETGFDIREGDIITNIVRLDNGLKWFPSVDQETWRVVLATVSSPGFMEYRDITIERIVAGGPALAG